jgi:hypothetical protein
MTAVEPVPTTSRLGPLARYEQIGIAFVLRGGGGGDKAALGAAQGGLFTEGYESGKS